jgi:hypothetical protein
MDGYWPCLGEFSGAGLAGETGGLAAEAGGTAVAEVMCPSMGAIADARLMMPITTRITGHV